jgi:hypothetical protein
VAGLSHLDGFGRSEALRCPSWLDKSRSMVRNRSAPRSAPPPRLAWPQKCSSSTGSPARMTAPPMRPLTCPTVSGQGSNRISPERTGDQISGARILKVFSGVQGTSRQDVDRHIQADRPGCSRTRGERYHSRILGKRIPAEAFGGTASARHTGPGASGSASKRCHVSAARFSPSGPDSTTRAATRDNATAGMPHLVHVDLRDLHDHVACPRLQTARYRPNIAYQSNRVSPEHAGGLWVSYRHLYSRHGSLSHTRSIWLSVIHRL